MNQNHISHCRSLRLHTTLIRRLDSPARMRALLPPWYRCIFKPITKFAGANNVGASAMFRLFQAQPAILEKLLKRPAAAAAAVIARQQPDSFLPSSASTSNRGDGNTANSTPT